MRNNVLPLPSLRVQLRSRLFQIRQAEEFLKRFPLPKEEECEQMAFLFDLLVREERRILKKLWRLK